MKKLIILLLMALSHTGFAQNKKPRFKVLVFAENGGHHLAYSKAAKIWLNQLATDNNFIIDYVQDTHKFRDEYLNQYQLLIQLDYPPYSWKANEMEAFKKYLTKGKGGWIGFHHATLLGDFDGYKMWPWFSDFMGEIQFKNYIPDFADGNVSIEDLKHPVMKGVPAHFTIEKEEWYTYNKSPRPNVRVLARVDESSYKPKSEIVMGDHPVIWTNEKIKARNVYIFMGHSPELFNNIAYKTIVKNAIFWASGQDL
ncbi:ThuA domain-containing protein [Pedobacter nototheniae]|uniref:ThuA domain-containing protein n=1 Tax=Pedobacter nototheniae TaxID=2488994 RepID=UPI00292DE061|nr:ThuA domain-containing protein [Pedobacter nototheniae]